MDLDYAARSAMRTSEDDGFIACSTEDGKRVSKPQRSNKNANASPPTMIRYHAKTAKP